MIETILLIIFSVGFLVLAWKKPDWALAVIIVSLPGYLIRFKLLSIPTTLLEVMILLCFLAWIVKRLVTNEYEQTSRSDSGSRRVVRFRFSPFLIPAILFLLIAIISSLHSPDLKAALGLFKAYFLEPLLFFFVFINTINSPRQIKLMLWAAGISALFVSVIAIWQYLDLLPSFEPWISQIPKRVTSVFEYPNAVGLYLTPILVLFLGILLLSKKIKDQANWFPAGVVLFSLLAIILSFSRGAFLGILAGLIFFSFFSQFKKQIWISLIILLLLVLVIPQTRQIVLSVVMVKDISTDVRAVLWQGTWNLLKARPILGSGLAGFPILYDQYRLIKHTELPLYPHNVFLNFWVELGIVGLIVFLWLIIKYFWIGVKARKLSALFNPSSDDNLPVILIGTMIAILAYGLVDVPYFKNDLSVFFWFLIGLMAVKDQSIITSPIEKKL